MLNNGLKCPAALLNVVLGVLTWSVPNGQD